MPPFLEYLDSLLHGTGPDLDLRTFKVTDQSSGRMLGVRADMTPQVARIDAHRLARGEVPIRLCYAGTVLHARANRVSGSRCPIQVGAEIYGHAGVESDIEAIDLMLEMLRCAGVDRPHIDVGHLGVFRGLARGASPRRCGAGGALHRPAAQGGGRDRGSAPGGGLAVARAARVPRGPQRRVGDPRRGGRPGSRATRRSRPRWRPPSGTFGPSPGGSGGSARWCTSTSPSSVATATTGASDSPPSCPDTGARSRAAGATTA